MNSATENMKTDTTQRLMGKIDGTNTERILTETTHPHAFR